MHVRAQLRKNMVELLKQIPGFEQKVFESRVHPLSKDDMPCIVVKSGTMTIEKAVKSNMQLALQKRFIVTDVYAFGRAKENIEDTLDELAETIENKVFSDYTLGSVAAETSLVDVEPIISADPSSPIGVLQFRFVSVVYTREGSPQTPIRN